MKPSKRSPVDIKMFSLESFRRTYETDTKKLVIGGKTFRFFVPKYLDGFIDPRDPFQAFPLWAKIWEASIVLAGHLADTRIDPGKHFLEIGCGLGTVGVVAAFFGHRITATENDPHALEFARANAHQNLPKDKLKPEIIQLDWNSPQIEGLFDCIVGSEIVYHQRDFQPLLDFFKSHLKPGGEIILAEGVRKTSIAFFAQVAPLFTMKAQKKIIRSKNREIRVILCRMKFR